MADKVFVDGARSWQRLMALAAITDADRPYTRRSFGERFLQGRDFLRREMESLGLDVHIDAAGNLIGRLPGNGRGRGVIAIGSHSDTVPGGGRFDGTAGVIAALECVQSWRGRGVVLNHDVEVVDYLAEEPSEWGISCIGSRGISGFMSEELLATRHPQSGETLAAAITRMGGAPENLRKRSDIAASFELHIEQGRVLESAGVSVGIVSAIVGIIRLEVVLKGQANHAGTTPMALRADALCAAAEIVLAAEVLAVHRTQTRAGYFVATCGQIAASPNASNVIAGEVRLVFDIRADDKAQMERFCDDLQAQTAAIAARRGIVCTTFARLTDTFPVQSDSMLMHCLHEAAAQQNTTAMTMASGAGHDAAFLAHIAPMAMLFVPSRDGKSHCPEEWTDEAALACGIAVLCGAVELFDKKSP